MSSFEMPIMPHPGPGKPRITFTWDATEADRAAARNNHSQTLERLKERGGLSWCELAAVLEHRRWSRMDQAAAKARCLKVQPMATVREPS